MELYVLFGQRKERYKGEYGIEALACMSYYDDDGNPDYLPEKKQESEDCGEFEAVEIITLDVDESAINSILRPAVKAIKATVRSLKEAQ